MTNQFNYFTYFITKCTNNLIDSTLKLIKVFIHSYVSHTIYPHNNVEKNLSPNNMDICLEILARKLPAVIFKTSAISRYYRHISAFYSDINTWKLIYNEILKRTRN